MKLDDVQAAIDEGVRRGLIRAIDDRDGRTRYQLTPAGYQRVETLLGRSQRRRKGRGEPGSTGGAR